MKPAPALTPEQKANLSAYLDGELPRELTEEIDQMLAESAEARCEVEGLSRTWDMLDLLPPAKATEEFASRTVSMVATGVHVPAEAPRDRLRRGLMTAGLIGLLLMLAAISFEIGQRILPGTSANLLEDLPVIEDLHLYREAESIEYLHKLQASELFDEPMDAPTP